QGRQDPDQHVDEPGALDRIRHEQADHAGEKQHAGHDREQRGVSETAGKEAATRSPVPIQHSAGGRERGLLEESGQPPARPLAPARRRGRSQSRSSSNRPGWRSAARTRLGAAISALISPRRTNRRPPSLMLWTLPARAQPPMVAGRKRTLAAERIPAASSRLIQSVAAGGTS